MTVRELRVLVCKIPFELDDSLVVVEGYPDDDAYFEAHGFELNMYWDGETAHHMEVLAKRGEKLENYERCVALFT